MTWSVRSRIDESRWFTCEEGMAFTADPVTAGELWNLPGLNFGLTPVGPVQMGVTTPSELLAAAMWSIPAPEVSGDAPDYPRLPKIPPGAVS